MTTAIERCVECGANLALVGRVHNCRPRVAPVTPRDAPKPRPVTPRDALLAERARLLDRLAEINALIGPMTAAERQRRARAKSRG